MTPGQKDTHRFEDPDERSARHRAWIKSFGFTARDWERIKGMAMEVTRNLTPGALNDLDAPFRVGAVLIQDRDRYAGDLLGTYNGRALLYWPRGEDR